MRTHKLPFANTHAFSSFFLDYIHQKESLQKFINRFPTPENFLPQIQEKESTFPDQNRQVLTATLKEQYIGLVVTESVTNNISSLAKRKTFTITTGHQLNIFTGPLYFIYKIITVINACKKLKSVYPDYHFVPVYWMASEDHDFEEIQYFKLYGKKYIWNTDQKGAVGRFNTNGIESLYTDIPGDISIFKNAYSKNKTLAAAVRHYVNELFGKEGVVVVDADHRSLKTLFKDVIQDDLFQNSSKNLVEERNKQLESLGYHTQVFVRDINFFYLGNGLRSRLEKTNGKFNIVDTDIEFTPEKIKQLVEKEPEKFSPNVILRPLYQEMILPNLAYVGGPAEVTYWLQLKGVFDHFKVPFPMLMPRNFALVMDAPTSRKFDKIELEFKDLFEDKHYIFNHWFAKHNTLNLSLMKEVETIQQFWTGIKDRASRIDPTLNQFVAAEAKRNLKGLKKIEQKFWRAEKRKQVDKLHQIETVKDSLFPGGGLQERTDNFLNFYQQDPKFIQKLIDLLDPFDYQFNIFQYISPIAPKEKKK
ncbi:MAG: bacillithiol biosynthesis cysteine-adding enzyme BshC [Bacteroidia bacterium]|nr:bacillithiol biosynthesis cysteine-adding enzyme BshC [Bacteroidia bacterium]